MLETLEAPPAHQFPAYPRTWYLACRSHEIDKKPLKRRLFGKDLVVFRTESGQVARVAAELFAMGCYEISLGDTIGQGTPERIDAMLAAVSDVVPAAQLAGHYHDTSGRALENIEASLARGLRVFDAAVGGLGGCPYAPGAAGNVATEAVHDRLTALGYETGLDRAVLIEAARMAQAMREG